jgi:allophanate hydrolase
MRLLVIGSALRELCGDQAALGLQFLETARTAPRYRLYSIDDAYAALVEDAEAGAVIAGELVEVAPERLEELLAGEPPGVVQAPVELEDGRVVSAAFAQPSAVAGALEITAHGGFAAYRRSVSSERPETPRARG